MLFIAKGKVVHKQVGVLPEPMLRHLMDQYLAVAVPSANQADEEGVA